MTEVAGARERRPKRGSITALLHLWLGLTSGVILTMSGLTGSYLAFYPELEKAFIAPLQQSAGKRPESLETFYTQGLIKVAKPGKGSWNIELPKDGGVITSRFQGGGKGNRMVSVDPVTFEVVRDVYWGKTLSTWLYELHYRLLLGRDGQPVMGVLALLALVMVGAGGVLWWRSGKSMKARFAVDLSGTIQRKLYDIHRIFGIVGLAFLVVILGTAAAMNLPKQVRPVLAAVSPIVPTPRQIKSGPAEGRSRIPVDQAVAVAQARLPKGDVRWVQVPGNAKGAYTVRVWQPGDWRRRFPNTYVWVDQYSGAIIGVRDGLTNTASDTILASFYPLHSGEAFGVVGRAVVAVVGLIPLALLVSGVLRWRSKARSQAAKKRRQAARPQIQN